jgi:hypothetical protein
LIKPEEPPAQSYSQAMSLDGDSDSEGSNRALFSDEEEQNKNPLTAI